MLGLSSQRLINLVASFALEEVKREGRRRYPAP